MRSNAILPFSKPTTTTNGIVTLRPVGFTPGNNAGTSNRA